jgi:hypothetical protein
MDEVANNVLVPTFIAVFLSVYVVSTWTMIQIKMFVEHQKINVVIAEQSFSQTSRWFRVIIVPFSLNSSDQGLKGCIERQYMLDLLLIFFAASAPLMMSMAVIYFDKVLGTLAIVFMLGFAAMVGRFFRQNYQSFKAYCQSQMLDLP